MKCLHLHYQKQLYIKVKKTRGKYCQDIVIKKREICKLILQPSPKWCSMKKPEVFYEKRCSCKLHQNHRKTSVPESLFLIKSQTRGHRCFPANFCEISKNTLFTEHLWPIVSNFICGVFFIFSIIKKFRLKKSGFVRKMSTSGKPTLLSRNCGEKKSRNTFYF